MKIKKLAYSIAIAITISSLAACGKSDAKGENVSIEASVETSTEIKETETLVEDSKTSEEETKTSESSVTESSVSVEEKTVIVDKSWNFDNVDTSWIDPEKPMVALSFDDGPVSLVGENSTATRIQNALSENGMHATFFYWGNTWNDVTQKEIERAYELGFELGNHTRTHADLTKLYSAEKIDKEISYIDEKLSKIAVGQEHFLVRPPYLSIDQMVKDSIVAPLISCGMDTKDWNGATKDDIVNTIVSALENGTLDGQIVLMHETYEATAEAVEYLVPYLKEQGYQVVSISEMYCVRGQSMRGGKVYTKCDK